MEMDIQRLPEECITQVIALTGPRDACRSAAVSATFRSVATSDGVWERFLPPDYESILARALTPVEYSSKKELYFRLCDQPLLLDGGKRSFVLDKSSGAKCYTLSARALKIVWGDRPEYWKWVPMPRHSGLPIFPEAAELLRVCWLEIEGKIDSKDLSPRTTYAAYLIFTLTPCAGGLDCPPQEGSVMIRNELVSYSKVCVQQLYDFSSCDMHRLSGRGYLSTFIMPRATRLVMSVIEPGRKPSHRSDDCMEMELGDFQIGDEGDEGEILINLTEVNGEHWKNGLVVYGMEIRPKNKEQAVE